MKTAEEVIQDVIKDGDLEIEGCQPSILMHRNINHDQVGEYTSLIVNNNWASRIKEHIGAGWIVFRIQTEFGQYGHTTLAYLAKMK